MFREETEEMSKEINILETRQKGWERSNRAQEKTIKELRKQIAKLEKKNSKKTKDKKVKKKKSSKSYSDSDSDMDAEDLKNKFKMLNKDLSKLPKGLII